MILSDREICREINKRRLIIEPFDARLVQPASLDLRLADGFKTLLPNGPGGVIDPRVEAVYSEFVVGPDRQRFALLPGELVLASTVERFEFPADLVGRCEGKSSLGRLGLLVHATAGFFDPGFCGTATLELANLTEYPIHLFPGMKICQMSFNRMGLAAAHPYGSEGLGSKYVNQSGATGSRSHENFV